MYELRKRASVERSKGRAEGTGCTWRHPTSSLSRAPLTPPQPANQAAPQSPLLISALDLIVATSALA